MNQLEHKNFKRKVSYFSMVLIVLFLFSTALFFTCRGSSGQDGSLRGSPVPSITLLTTTREYDPVRYYSAYRVAEWWNELGLKVNVVPLEFNMLTASVRDYDSEKMDWHVYMYAWTGRVERADPDMFIFSINHSSQTRSAGNNYQGYSNPKFDALAEAQRRITDPEVRRVVVHAAQELLAEDVPFVTLHYRYVLHAYRNKDWSNATLMPGEGLYHEWVPFHIRPLSNRHSNNSVDKWLVIAGNQEPGSLDPITAATVWEWKLLRMMYDKLARVNRNFRPEPWAAESIKYINDRLVEVVLRPGMKFHDGFPVRPRDIKFTFEYMMNSDIPYFNAFLKPISSIDITDEGHIQFHLHQPYSPFVACTLAQIPILPEHLWKGKADDDIIPLVGSGPLRFAEWKKGKSIKFEKYSDYFAASDIHIAGIEYRLFPDSKAMLQALINGDADMTGASLEPEFVDEIKNYPDLRLIQVPDIGFHFMGFNCYIPPFNNKALRKAAARSMDLQVIVDDLLDGYADPGGPGQSISTGNPFWKNHDIKPHVFDIEEARKILQNAGYTWNKQGRLLYP